MAYSQFLDWAGAELDDTRHVYARDTRRPLDAPLVFMPENEARRLRPDTRAGHLVCPVPGCPHPELTARHVKDRRDHFVHTNAPALAHADFPATVARQILRCWATSLYPRFEVLCDQTIADVGVTVLVNSPTGRQVALCYTDRTLDTDTWQTRRALLESEGVAGVWIFPPRRRFFSPPPHLNPAPAHTAGLVLDTHLFRAMRRQGSWPLILNIERQQLANLIVPGRAIAGRLHIPTPPFAKEVLHVVASPLERCELCKDGIATPAVNKRDLEKIRSGGLRRSSIPGRLVLQQPTAAGAQTTKPQPGPYPSAGDRLNDSPSPRHAGPRALGLFSRLGLYRRDRRGSERS
jgi:hypothetical protein